MFYLRQFTVVMEHYCIIFLHTLCTRTYTELLLCNFSDILLSVSSKVCFVSVNTRSVICIGLPVSSPVTYEKRNCFSCKYAYWNKLCGVELKNSAWVFLEWICRSFYKGTWKMAIPLLLSSWRNKERSVYMCVSLCMFHHFVFLVYIYLRLLISFLLHDNVYLF